MNMQEMSTAIQYRLPVKIFILNNQYMGMVRQWQELLHGGRYSESYTDSLPDFVKLAEAYGGHGIRCTDPAKLDAAIMEMIETPKPVIFDCVVDQKENCFPMIPSGKAHNEMLLAELEDDGGHRNRQRDRRERARCWFEDAPSSVLRASRPSVIARSEATKQSRVRTSAAGATAAHGAKRSITAPAGLLRFARNDGTWRSNKRQVATPCSPSPNSKPPTRSSAR